MAFDAILWAKLKGCASLKDGKVPAEQLPSYIDDVIEVASYDNLPEVGEKSKIYYTLDTCESYRWGSSTYILVTSGNDEELATKDDLKDFITASEVDSKIAAIDFPEPDLSDYYNKEQTDTQIKNAVDAINIPEVDLSNYYTKEEVDGLIPDTSKFIESIPEEYVTEDELATLATKEELESVQNTAGQNSVKLFQLDSDLVDINAKLETIPTKVSDLDNDAGYLTEHQSLEGYAKIDDLSGFISEIPSEYITQDELSAAGYATEDFVATKIQEAQLEGKDIDLSNYYTKAQVDDLIPDTSAFISEIPSEYITEDELADKNYATKSDLEGHATEQWVKDQAYLTEHQDISGKADVNHEHAQYALKDEIPDISGKAEIEHSHSIADITDYQAPDLSGYVTTEQFSQIDLSTKADIEHKHSLDDIEGYTPTDLTDYATKEFVADAIKNADFPESDIDLTDYYTKSQVDDLIPDVSEFIKMSDVEVKGYITDEALSGYAKVSDLPTVPTKVSQLENDAKYLTEHQDLSDYATKDELPNMNLVAMKADLVLKADDVLFTSDADIVQFAIGGFKVGDPLKGKSLKEILRTLLIGDSGSTEDPDDSVITVDNITTSYLSHDGGVTFEAIGKSNVITDHTQSGIKLEGVFEDADGNVGYQIQTAMMNDAEEAGKVYIDSRYRVVDIQKWNLQENKWKSTNDKDAWIWEDGGNGSPRLETIAINGSDSVEMIVYSYWFDVYEAMGASEWRFIVKLDKEQGE